ncbi:Ribosomal protein S6 kinase alpha-3 [Auxenochlorella protothecoides]|uniref:Ribosomal protein S6 kinase alpha-3 n=1 Tax=Auxenochlorella protothecoides TaxID=3075 RepID=A0A087SDH0_AUXPR|nr:Ribosomal protein S6 kinase alpha-3 [Auxenochlorella protothecoides]KFM23774.1 Ribosomal protein S6 kinase alpha-3 [Auxenochlorella protothecoides]
MGGHYPVTELRRNASVPSMGLPRQMPRSISMCLPPGKRAFAAETEGVQSWDEYQSIRDAQAARRPAARRCLENTLEIAARARSFPLTRGYSRRGSLDALNLPPCARRLEPAFAPVQPEERDLKLVPLQHLLLSPAAAALSTLDVKAIICKIALDLDALHAQRSLHRHVSVACIAVPATGHLPASRLLPHGANIRCEGGGGTATCPVAFQGMEPYLAPELAMVAAGDDARSPAMHTPACDMWSLGVVLFVMLSGSHVPFGNRGLGQTSIPNMPGRGESVDALQSWLQEHLECKMGVVNAMARAGSDTAACRDMRVLGFDPGAVDVVLGLLRADPAQRLSAHAVARHGWLAEVAAESATWRRPEAGPVPDAQGLPPTPPIPPAQPPPPALSATHASPDPLPPIAPGTLGWLARPTCTGPCPALATLHPVVLLGAGPQVGTQPVGLTRLPPDPGSCTLLADGSWWIPVPVAAACQRLPTSA